MDVYTILAIIGIVGLLLTIIGSSLGFDIELPIEDNPYIIRGLFSFISGLGLGGLNYGLMYGLLIGILFTSISIFTMYLIFKLKSENNVNPKESIGNSGVVTITIPANGIGKITTIVGSSNREVEATSNEKIKMNEKITVINVKNEIYTVKKKVV